MNDDNRELYARFDRDVALLPMELKSQADLARYGVRRDGTAEFRDPSGYRVMATVDPAGTVRVENRGAGLVPNARPKSTDDAIVRAVTVAAQALLKHYILPLRSQIRSMEVADRIDEEFVNEMSALCERVKQVEDRTVNPRGYWRDGGKAQRNDLFSHDGSAWLCQRSTRDKPCVESPDWMRIARKGRDGRDAKGS